MSNDRAAVAQRDGDDGLNPSVLYVVAEATNGGLFRTDFRLCELTDSDGGRLMLDRRNTEYVISFLEQTPRITNIFQNYNICRDDGAMELMIDFFRNRNQHITEVSFHGNRKDQDDEEEDDEDAGRHDDGSMLECFSSGMHNDSVVSRVVFRDVDFSLANNSESLLHMLQQKTNFGHLKFNQECKMDGAILSEGISVQETLGHFEIDDCTFVGGPPQDLIMGLKNSTSTLKTLKLSRLVGRFDHGRFDQAVNLELEKILTTQGCKIQSLCMKGGPPSNPKAVFQNVFLSNISILDMEWTGIITGHRGFLTETFLSRNKYISRVESMKEKKAPLGCWAPALAGWLRLRDPKIHVSPTYLALSHFLPHHATETALASRKRSAPEA